MARRSEGLASIQHAARQGAGIPTRRYAPTSPRGGEGGRNQRAEAPTAHSTAPKPKAAAGLTSVHSTPATTLDTRSPTPLTPLSTPKAVPSRRSSTIELVSEPSTELTTGF